MSAEYSTLLNYCMRRSNRATSKFKRDHLNLAGMEGGQYPFSNENILTTGTDREHYLWAVKRQKHASQSRKPANAKTGPA
jgi:hypothetical protein